MSRGDVAIRQSYRTNIDRISHKIKYKPLIPFFSKISVAVYFRFELHDLFWDEGSINIETIFSPIIFQKKKEAMYNI